MIDRYHSHVLAHLYPNNINMSYLAPHIIRPCREKKNANFIENDINYTVQTRNLLTCTCSTDVTSGLSLKAQLNKDRSVLVSADEQLG